MLWRYRLVSCSRPWKSLRPLCRVEVFRDFRRSQNESDRADVVPLRLRALHTRSKPIRSHAGTTHRPPTTPSAFTIAMVNAYKISASLAWCDVRFGRRRYRLSIAVLVAAMRSNSTAQVLVPQNGWNVGGAMSLPRPSPSAPPPHQQRWFSMGTTTVDRRPSRLPPQPSRPAPQPGALYPRHHRHTIPNVSVEKWCYVRLVDCGFGSKRIIFVELDLVEFI